MQRLVDTLYEDLNTCWMLFVHILPNPLLSDRNRLDLAQSSLLLSETKTYIDKDGSPMHMGPLKFVQSLRDNSVFLLKYGWGDNMDSDFAVVTSVTKTKLGFGVLDRSLISSPTRWGTFLNVFMPGPKIAGAIGFIYWGTGTIRIVLPKKTRELCSINSRKIRAEYWDGNTAEKLTGRFYDN